MISVPEPADEVQTSGRTRSRRRLGSALERRQRNRRVITYALFIGSAVLMVNALVGENGYLATVRARRDNLTLAASVARIRAANQALQEEVRRLKEDPTAIEAAARRDLGLIKPGETLVIIHDGRPTAAASAPR